MKRWYKLPTREIFSIWGVAIQFAVGAVGLYADYCALQAAKHFVWVLWPMAAGFVVLVIVSAYRAYERLRADNLERAQANQARRYNLENVVSVLSALIAQFNILEKTRAIADSLQSDLRVLAIIQGENGLAVLINAGHNESLEPGIPFEVFRTDSHTSDGEMIESPLGIIEVSHIQPNNCAHCTVTAKLDVGFWREQEAKLLAGQQLVDPPRNRVTPFIPHELSVFGCADLQAMRRHLDNVRKYLLGQQSMEEMNLQEGIHP